MLGRGTAGGDSEGRGMRPRSRRQSGSSNEDTHTSPRTPPPSSSANISDRLRDQVGRARKDAEVEELLEVIAENSGWTVEEMEARPESITSVELFLLNLPRIPQLNLFPNMTVVKIMSVGLTTMQDLADLTCVEELWLTDNEIRKIEGLAKMTRLRRLYLQGNDITSLDGLPPLKHLKELWLCRNKIKRVDADRHLVNVKRLRCLWLAGNPISSIEGTFRPFLSRLRDVSLAGCEIFCFSEIAHLRPLAGSLRKLWFSDPLFGENPICRLNNYTTFTLQLLGDCLEQLDHQEITDEQRQLAAAVHEKKRIYYSMRLRSLTRNYRLLSRLAQAHADRKIAEAMEAARELGQFLSPIQSCVRERQTYAGKCSSEPLSDIPLDALERLDRDISRAVGTREVQIQSISTRLAEAVRNSDAMHQLLQERLCVELHSGGNVRLDELASVDSTVATPVPTPPPPPPASSGPTNSTRLPAAALQRGGSRSPAPQDPAQTQSQQSTGAANEGYYQIGKELLENGFEVAADEFKSAFGIAGVEVNRVFRIVNRGLRLRFDDRIRSLEVDMTQPANRRKIVCLFSPVPESLESQGDLLRQVVLRSMDVADRKRGASKKGDPDFPRPLMPPPSNEGVPLTNSLLLADEERLRRSLQLGELSGVNANPNSLSGQIIVFRVFLGKSVQAIGGNRVVAPTTTDGAAGAAGAAKEAAFISRNRRVLLKDYSEDVFSAYRVPPGSDAGGMHLSAVASAGNGASGTSQSTEVGPRVWYCLDRTLILPEFVIDYTYTMSAGLGVSTLPSAIAALSLVTRDKMAVAIRDRLGAHLPSLSGSSMSDTGGSAVPLAAAATDWADLRTSCYHLLAFVTWCEEGSALSHLAKTEAENVLNAARKVIKNADRVLTPSLSTSSCSPLASSKDGAGSDQVVANPLTETHVAAYCTKVGTDSLTFCHLRGCALTSVPKEFTASAFGALVSLDLSGNLLTDFSWFAIAQVAPQLDSLNLQQNKLTRLNFLGTQMKFLTHLNVQSNSLCIVEEFAEVAESLPRLTHLYADDNPMLLGDASGAGKNRELLLLSYFLGTSLEVLNHIDLEGLSKDSVARWRLRRTLDLKSPGILDAFLVHVEQQRLFSNAPVGAAASPGQPAPSDGGILTESSDSPWMTYDMTCLDPFITSPRFFEGALQRFTSSMEYRSSFSPNKRQGSSASSLSVVSGNYTFSLPPPAAISYTHALVQDMSFVNCFAQLSTSLRSLSLSGHNIVDISPVLFLSALSYLDVSDNVIATLPDLTSLAGLLTLDISFNALASLQSMGTPPSLRCLCASGNKLAVLDRALLCKMETLRELYLANNAMSELSDFYALKDMPSLTTIDVSGNPFTGKSPKRAKNSGSNSSPSLSSMASAADTRTYFIHLFRQLKVLDGVPISQLEVQRARDTYAGKMSSELLADRAPDPSTWPTVQKLDLSQCALREVALLEPFTSLQVLDLNRNALTRINGVAPLKHLRALDLSFNRLASAVALSIGDALRPLTSLESLSLEANHLNDLNSVGLQLPNLQFLNLKGNELQYLDRGLHHLPQLRELILDQNKLRSLSAECFTNSPYLTDLSAEDNTIRATEGLGKLHYLERLNLGANRLGELQHLMTDLQHAPLQEAVFIGNPVARKSNYRAIVVAGNVTLVALDKKTISREERAKAESIARQTEQYAVPANVVIDMSFVNGLAAQQQQIMQHQQQQGMPPGAGGSGSPVLPQSLAIGGVHAGGQMTRGTGQRLQPLNGTNRRAGAPYGRGSGVGVINRNGMQRY